MCMHYSTVFQINNFGILIQAIVQINLDFYFMNIFHHCSFSNHVS